MFHSISSQGRRESQHTGIAQQLSDRALKPSTSWPHRIDEHFLGAQREFAQVTRTDQRCGKEVAGLGNPFDLG